MEEHPPHAQFGSYWVHPYPLWTLLPATAHATCGEECDTESASKIDDCRSQFGDDPADADELAAWIRDARDDYRSCLDDWASAGRPRGGRQSAPSPYGTAPSAAGSASN